MDITELYTKKKNFPQYRREKLAEVENTTTSNKLKELRAKRARMVAEIDAEIARVKHELSLFAAPKSKTALKAELTIQLSKEKSELDEQFAREVCKMYQDGTPIAKIAHQCGASSLSVFYQALNYLDDETVRLNVAEGVFKPEDHEWEYSDVTKVHRYAVNKARTHFRVHDATAPEDVCYIRRADHTLVAGAAYLKENYDPSRAQELVDILDSNVDMSKYRERANPYA